MLLPDLGALLPIHGADMAVSLLGRDAACAVFCAVAAKIWVGFWTNLAATERIDPNLSRKMIHTGSAPLFMLCWPLFSDGPTARVLASAVPLIQIIRLYRAGKAAPVGAAQSEEALVKAISRSGERSEALGGPFLYTLVLFAATAFGWRSLAASTAVCQMAVGDGVADIFGRRFGKTKWPFSRGCAACPQATTAPPQRCFARARSRGYGPWVGSVHFGHAQARLGLSSS